VRASPYILPHIFRWSFEQLLNPDLRVAVDVCVETEREKAKKEGDRETNTTRQRDSEWEGREEGVGGGERGREK